MKMLQYQNNSIIRRFSSHLFWDTDRDALDMTMHSAYIIKQVLEYGRMDDWELICQYYGLNGIAEVVKGFRELDPRALTFVAAVSRVPLNQFRCYTTLQSKTAHWNF